MFSATGNILKAPAIAVFAWEATNCKQLNYRGDYRTDKHKLNGRVYIITSQPHSPLTVLGMIPGVSTLSGAFKVLLGLAHTIIHLVAAIFDQENRVAHLKEALFGAKQIGIGLWEMIPMQGILICMIFSDLKIDEVRNKLNSGEITISPNQVIKVLGDKITILEKDKVFPRRT